MTARFLASELPLIDANKSRFHIIPAPYEATVSYGAGTSKAPQAIIEASNQLELWTGFSEPSTQGIYTHPPVDCNGSPEEVLTSISLATEKALSLGPQKELPPSTVMPLPTFSPLPCLGASVIPILLGGEHTVSLGALRALHKKYGKFGIIQFDAHADLRNSYEGTPYSHACVMRRALEEMDLPLFQIGVRSLCHEEKDFRSQMKVLHLDASTMRCPRPWPVLQKKRGGGRPIPALLPESFPDIVYLTFDVDAFDSSLMPATGTPEPGGLFWWDALHLVQRSLGGRRLIGFDVVELAPIEQLHSCTYTVARLVHEIMGFIAN